MITRYTKDGVTVTLTGSALTMARQAADAASRGMLTELERIAGEVARNAEAEWYTLVQRRTGLTGDIGVITTISPTEVRVSVGSLDRRVAGGKAVPLYVRQPRPTSLMAVKVSNEEWGRAKRAQRPVGPIGTIYVPNLWAAAGKPKFLVPYLITGPMRKLVKTNIERIRATMIASVDRG